MIEGCEEDDRVLEFPDVYFEMGGCMGVNKPLTLPPEAMKQIQSIRSYARK